MNFKNKTIWALGAFAVLAGFSSCGGDDEWNTIGDGKVEMSSSARAFILNEGSMGKNNSNIVYFDWMSGVVNAKDLFETQNGKKLGDTGNDILAVDNNKLIVAVNMSNYVALLDGYGIERSRISFEQYKNLGQVRNVDEENGIVYAVSYGGYVSRIRINGNTLEYIDSLKVGERPEDVAESNGKLYVTLQGADYKDNRMAVVGSDFKTVSYATVMQDPMRVLAMDGKIYVQGYGAAYDSPWGIYDTATGKYTEMGHATSLALSNGTVYLANSQTNWSTFETTTTLSTYDFKTGKANAEFFKNVPAVIPSSTVYSVSVNPFDGTVYLATSDYMSDGVIYAFDAQGNYLRTFSSYGLNPNKIAFLK